MFVLSGTVAFVGSHLDVVPANPETWERNPFKLCVEVGDICVLGIRLTDTGGWAQNSRFQYVVCLACKEFQFRYAWNLKGLPPYYYSNCFF